MKVVKPKGAQRVLILGLRGCTQVLNGIKFNRDTDLSGYNGISMMFAGELSRLYKGGRERQ